MSHTAGTVQPVTPNIIIGPDSGAPATVPNIWSVDFAPTPATAPGGTKFVMLHFTTAGLAPGHKLVVELGWGENDEFSTVDGLDFWTRPIKLTAAGTVMIQYMGDGSATGGVVLVEYGRGEEVTTRTNGTNLDLFLLDDTYDEPPYERRGLCNPTPNWANVNCLPDGDIRKTVARSCGLSIVVHDGHVSSCSGTLIAPDLVLTAGHCMSDPGGIEEASGSFCFDFETNCDGGKPASYAPRFFKIKKVIRRKNLGVGSLDYAIIQLKVPPGGIGLPPIAMRPDLPVAGNRVFQIHHPQGVIKKVSANPTSSWATISDLGAASGFSTYVYIRANADLTGGSSGSSLFDESGRIIGIADIDTSRSSAGGVCGNGFLAVTEVLRDLATVFPPAGVSDVMMVFDKSGSMSMDAGTGRTKIVEARDAASLFVQLIQADAGHRIGLVSFSSEATNPADFNLNNANTNTKELLIGPSSPFSGGIIGGISTGGLTSIGGGLEAARSQFPTPTANQRTILLLTDGLQNTAPLIEEIEPLLNDINVNVIGFGSEASLDGLLLNRVAQAHNGLYTRAGDPLDLKKFFAMSFGNIFGSGTLVDPNHFLKASELAAEAFPFTVCSEDEITIVVGWDKPASTLGIKLKSPSNTTITPTSVSVVSSTGQTWTFLKLKMPYAGERDGIWNVIVERIWAGGGDVPPVQFDLNYFINVVVKGGPRLNIVENNKPHFTGDVLRPLVQLVNSDGTIPHNGEVTLTMKRPRNSIGNLLTDTQMEPALETDGDVISSRHATLLKLEHERAGNDVDYIEETFKLYDDGHHGDGAMEPDGIFGDILNDKLNTEGNYTFRAVATYGDGCTGSRELFWSHYVNCGIDPSQSDVETELVTSFPDGKQRVRVLLAPKDAYGNNLGAGRAADLNINGSLGNTLDSGIIDKGDGTYEVIVVFNPEIGNGPGVIITQPDRPPVVFEDTHTAPTDNFQKYKSCIGILVVILLVIILILLFIILK